ncbi:MAG: hypothetical protein JXA18_10085 [Chitinispirillaceae bacterium]|nr:hypothetical protein [Chitinispirillaceae bacterium]
MAATTLYEQKDESRPVDDLILEKNGRYVKFSSEITQHILQQRSSEDQFVLHQTVMVIDYEDTADAVAIHTGIQKAVEGSIIKWNLIYFGGEAQETARPALFRYIKPSDIIGAAEKAGIIPRSRVMTVLSISIILFTSIIIAVIIRLFNAGAPMTLPLLLEILKGGVHDRALLVAAASAGITESLLFSVLSRYFKTHDRRLQEMIADHLRSANTDQVTESVFITAVKERFLMLAMPMAVVIGDLHRIDVFSKKTFMEILTDKQCGTIGHILWIICEKVERSRGTGGILSAKRNGLPQGRIDHRYVFINRLPLGKKTAMNDAVLAA